MDNLNVFEVENVSQLPMQFAYWASTRSPEEAARFFQLKFRRPAGTVYHCKTNNVNYIPYGEPVRVGQ